MGILSVIERYYRRKSIRYSVPFIVLVVGGSFFLREFTQLQYKYKPLIVDPIREEATKLGIDVKKRGEVTLEKEYEKIKKMDIDHWENKRIARPWEE